jgi:hypothetical protein
MGPRAFRPLSAVRSLPVAFFLLAAAPLLLSFTAWLGRAQVFVVGERTATAGISTKFRPTHIVLPTTPMDAHGITDLIRGLQSEQGFAHRDLPLGAGLTLIANGKMTPGDDDYKRMLYAKGESAAPGERVEISSLKFGADRIVIDLNGGPYAKHRFLSHVSINNVQLAQQGPLATGCRVTLIFEGGMPAVTPSQVKALLDPVIDFSAHTAAEAYANTLTPKVRAAVDAHEILVGMDRRMVLAAVGEPHDKHREHQNNPNDGSITVIEEWIYGAPPEATRFVRFRNDQVVRLEIAALGKPLEIRDKNEVDTDAAPALLARTTITNGDAQPGAGYSPGDEPDHTVVAAPTLRRPGEVPEVPDGVGRVKLPSSSDNPHP